MTFGEKLKSIRRQAGYSQEKLAEKIGVSRQAITKWETDRGIPDIENIMAISRLFDISVDELISEQKSTKNQMDYLYESITEYDIDNAKRYDMKLGGANKITVSGYDGEKIRVRLASNTLSTIQSDFKLKIDDIKNGIDLDMNIVCNTLDGAVEINQLNSTSQIHVPQGIGFKTVKKGLGNCISYQKNGIKSECFADEDSENVIELNGVRSELVICTSDCQGEKIYEK